jgi:hypothetical protein
MGDPALHDPRFTHFGGSRQKINLLLEHAGIEFDPY